jgi:hypothetical protein
MHIKRKNHPPGRRGFPVWTFLCVEKLRMLQLASVRTIQQPVRTILSVRSSFRIFFPKNKYGKIAATVRTTWISVWMPSSIRQVSQFKSRHPDAGVSNMEIACIRSTVRTTILLVRTREASIWKLLAADVRPSGRQCTTVRTRLISGKIFSENFRVSVA